MASQTAGQLDTKRHRALSDPSRLRILEALQEATAALDARELGRHVGLHVSTVRSHLRVLAAAGLVSAEREEPTRPGRPRVLYRAAANPPDAVALPSYRLLVQILAGYLAGSQHDPSAHAEEAGRIWGAQLVRRPPPATSLSKAETIDQVVRLHQQYGFKPQLRRAKNGQEIVLEQCPLREIAKTYRAVICPIHLGLMRGALAELRTGVHANSLEPFADSGACVGHLTSA